MYIHSYQIHNVLNVYRKQLSHGPGLNRPSDAQGATTADKINISADGKRQSIMDKISTEIVERIAQTGPESQFEEVLSSRLSHHSQLDGPQHEVPSDFTYTVIDENNRKITNTLPIQEFSPFSPETETAAQNDIDNRPVSDLESLNSTAVGFKKA